MTSKSYFKFLIFFLLVGLLIRIILANSFKFFTAYGDLSTFQAWGNILTEHSFNSFYSGWSDYLPGYLYILWFITLIYKWLLVNSFTIPVEIFYKLPSILTDLGNFIFIYLIVQNFTTRKKSFTTASIYLLSPVFLANSTLWGQADSFITFFLLSSFYYLIKGKYWLSAILISLAQTIKPIAILSLPFYLIYMFQKKAFKDIIIYLTLFSIIILLLFIPFNNSQNIFQFIIERHAITANQYPYTSVNAFNFWSLVTNIWQSDQLYFYGLTLHNWGAVLFATIYFILLSTVILRIKKTSNITLLLTYTLAICYLGLFMFLTRMHERHLYYGLTYLTMLIPQVSIFGSIAILVLYIIHLLNLYFPYSQANKPLILGLVLGKNDIILISLLSVIFFAYFFIKFLLTYVKQPKT